MRIISTLILTAALAATGASAAPSARAQAAQAKAEARLAKLLDGRTAGKPVDCINLRDIQSTEIIDGTAIVYRVGANRLYVNRPKDAHSLDSDDILVTKTFTSQLCSVDTVRLVDRTSRFPHGFVFLEKFVPYTKPPAAKG